MSGVVAPNPSFADTLQSVVRRGLRILVVGCPPGTFEDRYMRHQALVFWPSSEAKANDGTRIVPTEVGALMLTNMCSAELSRNVRKQANDRGLQLHPGMLSPGSVKRLLVEWLFDPVEMRPNNVVAMTPHVAPAPVEDDERGELVHIIDETIAGLQLIREGVLRLHQQTEALRAEGDTLRKLKELLR